MGKLLAWIFGILFVMWLIGSMQMKSEREAEKARVATMSPEELKAYNNDNCKWDKLGRYEYAIKQLLKDTDSYKRLGYEFYSPHKESGYHYNHVLEITYTAPYSLGRRVRVTRIHFEPDWCGEQVKVEEF